MAFLSEFRAKLAECVDVRDSLSRKVGDSSNGVRLLVMATDYTIDAVVMAAREGVKPSAKLTLGSAVFSRSGVATGQLAADIVNLFVSAPETDSEPTEKKTSGKRQKRAKPGSKPNNKARRRSQKRSRVLPVAQTVNGDGN